MVFMVLTVESCMEILTVRRVRTKGRIARQSHKRLSSAYNKEIVRQCKKIGSMAMADIKREAKMALKDAYYFLLRNVAYGLPALLPMKRDHVLFVELDRTAPSDSMMLVKRELEQRGFTCDFVSLSKYRGGLGAHALACLRMASKAGRSRAVVLCEAITAVGVLRMRKGSQVVQLWHGCGAFKKFGMSTAEKTFGASRDEKLRFPDHASTTLVTVSSPEVVWAYEEAMNLEGKGVVRPLGVSRTDVFFDEAFVAKNVDEVRKKYPQIGNRKIMLYAPTFRGHVTTAEAPDRLDIALLRERLGNEWVLLVKQHPHVRTRPPIPVGCEDFAFDVSDELTIEACLCAADACISDYSSLVFEYSLFRRPMAFFAYDREDYDDWRGFYYDYDELTPGPVLSTSREVADWAAGLSAGFDPTEVDAFRERFMSSCDGRSTCRIVDAVLALE